MDSVPIGRNPFVYLDFCFFEYCNFTCYYCRDSNEMMSKGKGRTAFDQAIGDFLERNSAGVFKLSGYGEASLWKELPEAVKAWARHFPAVQLISNGTVSRSMLKELCEMEHFQVCITLDGHTPRLNRFRIKENASLHQRILSTIDWLIDRERKVELNCVVTQANAGGFAEYLRWADERWGSAVRIMPFPVRPFYEREPDDIVGDMVATQEQVDHLGETIVGRHAEFAHLLPALPYTERLIQFLRASRRPCGCHVHRANFGVNPKLEALACPCAGDTMIEHLGNALGPISSVGTDPAVERRRHLNLVAGEVGPRCKTCFTHYEILNLYLEDLITERELAHVPSLSEKGTLAHVRAVKTEITSKIGLPV